MKAVKILIVIMGLFATAKAQTVTPNPGPYQPVSTKFQYTWLKWTGGIWNTGKSLFEDTVQIDAPAYAIAPADADSSTRIATTAFVKRNAGTGGGGVPVTRIWLDSLRRSGVSDTIYEYYSSFAGVDGRRFAFLAPSPGAGSGTVTSVGSGYGLSGGPITTTGTLFVDTAAVGGIGSKTYIQNYLALYLKLADTSGMLSPYLRSGTAAATYQPIGSYVTTMAAIGAVPNANGATISGSTLTLQPASASFGGLITTGTQSFAGTKTFTGAGHTVSGAMNVSGSFRSTSVAITSLGITPPAGQLTLLGSNERIIFTTSSTGTNSGQILIGVPVASGDLVIQTTPSWNAFDGTERVRLVNSTGNFLIGTATDVASSALTVESTTKGVLFPRMTTTQKNAISSPAEGLVVYDTTLHKLCVYTGSVWETVTSL